MSVVVCGIAVSGSFVVYGGIAAVSAVVCDIAASDSFVVDDTVVDVLGCFFNC